MPKTVNSFFIVCAHLLLFIGWNQIESARVLGLFPTLSKSHWILGSSLLKELALDGHDVTDVSPFKLTNPPANYHHVEVETDEKLLDDIQNVIFEIPEKSAIRKMLEMYTIANYISNNTLNSPEVKKLLQSNQQFDLLVLEIFFDYALLGFADRFDCPVIGLTTHGTTIWMNSFVGTPQPLSYVPHVHLSFTDRMDFWQRLGNFLFTTIDEIALSLMLDPVQEQLYQEAFPNAKRSLTEMKKHAVSLILVNSHFSLSFPRPYLPNMIEIGGFHVNRKVNPLPQNIRNFIENSTSGVIYFSMGSNVKPSTMGSEKRDALLRAFDQVKQSVIWNWDDASLVLDKKKFLLSKWLPQDDILAHPNVKLFITHGGLLSCTESIYHGKPIIGIPIFADQLLNTARAELAGWGVGISFTNLTEEAVVYAMNEVLNNEKYTKNVEIVSKRLRDQPLPPMDMAKYWVNYVLRHKGAEHLKSSAQHLNFIQYHNIDVYLFVLAVCSFAVFLIVKTVRDCCGCLSKIKSSPKKVTKKKIN